MCLLQGRGDFVLPGANRAWAIASSELKPLIKVGAGQQAQQAGTLCRQAACPQRGLTMMTLVGELPFAHCMPLSQWLC